MTHFLKRRSKPFEWREVSYDPNRQPRAAEIMHRRADFGFTSGFVVPDLSVPDTKHFVAMGGHKLDLTARTKPAIYLVALYGLYRVRSLCAALRGKKPPLTAREREVLTWAAHGKTAWEIGKILAIAERTVNEHVQTATHKLGAVNRTHAVAIALRERLIEL